MSTGQEGRMDSEGAPLGDDTVVGDGPEHAALRRELERGAREAKSAEVAEADARLEELLQRVALDEPAPETGPDGVLEARGTDAHQGLRGMHCARVVRAEAQGLLLSMRGFKEPLHAELAPGVELQVVQAAMKNGDFVVVDCADGEVPWVMGALQSRAPQELHLRADKIHLDAEQEILLRSGRGAIRLRRDGDVELVGSRISAMSRGLFRLVGRVLRLN